MSEDYVVTMPEGEVNILDIQMQSNDADAATVKDYLKALLYTLWKEGEGFSGKRPFGNSGWEYDLYEALVRAGACEGKLYEDDTLRTVDHKTADKLIFKAIEML